MLRVLSFNIHKGTSSHHLRSTLEEIKHKLGELKIDIALLQEIEGLSSKTFDEFENQLEFIADSLWPHYAYGRNAVFSRSHHGNAIFSRFPIISWSNMALPASRLEQRGLLCCTVYDRETNLKLHCATTHLSLFRSVRKRQLTAIETRLLSLNREHLPLILGGDFNDWKKDASQLLKSKLNLEEVFSRTQGGYSKTYPSYLPLLPLDRIYCAGLDQAGLKVRATLTLNDQIWKVLSDHLPLLVEIDHPKAL